VVQPLVVGGCRGRSEILSGLGSVEQKDVALITLPPLLRPVLSPAKETAPWKMSDRERQ
jgi:hypothetical protein